MNISSALLFLVQTSARHHLIIMHVILELCMNYLVAVRRYVAVESVQALCNHNEVLNDLFEVLARVRCIEYAYMWPYVMLDLMCAICRRLFDQIVTLILM
jgi:hypothetical protein